MWWIFCNKRKKEVREEAIDKLTHDIEKLKKEVYQIKEKNFLLEIENESMTTENQKCKRLLEKLDDEYNTKREILQSIDEDSLEILVDNFLVEFGLENTIIPDYIEKRLYIKCLYILFKIFEDCKL